MRDLDARLAALIGYWGRDEGAWRARAACSKAVARGEITTETFFPGRGDSVSVARARAVCAGCPVVVECRDFAVTNSQRLGIWGGESERQRRKSSHEQRREAM